MVLLANTRIIRRLEAIKCVTGWGGTWLILARVKIGFSAANLAFINCVVPMEVAIFDDSQMSLIFMDFTEKRFKDRIFQFHRFFFREKRSFVYSVVLQILRQNWNLTPVILTLTFV